MTEGNPTVRLLRGRVFLEGNYYIQCCGSVISRSQQKHPSGTSLRKLGADTVTVAVKRLVSCLSLSLYIYISVSVSLSLFLSLPLPIPPPSLSLSPIHKIAERIWTAFLNTYNTFPLTVGGTSTIVCALASRAVLYSKNLTTEIKVRTEMKFYFLFYSTSYNRYNPPVDSGK